MYGSNQWRYPTSFAILAASTILNLSMGIAEACVDSASEQYDEGLDAGRLVLS